MSESRGEQQVEHRCEIKEGLLGGQIAVCSCGWRSRSRVWDEQAQEEADAHLASTPQKDHA